MALATVACKDFQEINKDQNAVPEKDIRIEYLLNKSIYDAQMDPNVGERIFILYWDRMAKYEVGGGLSVMNANDDYNSTYWRDYGWQWIKNANLAVKLGQERLAVPGLVEPNLINVVQMARIWRAYLYSELADNFGPIPRSQAFKGPDVELTYDNVESVYKYILDELKDASAKIDMELPAISDLNLYDQIFQGNLEKWQKYANSLRLRYAMRLSNIDPILAKTHFEEAVKLPIITSLADIASVQEKGGWDPTTGVMTRPWNWQPVSLTMQNIMFGLGGVNVQSLDMVSGLAVTGILTGKNKIQNVDLYIKDPDQYLGIFLPKHLSEKTNVQSAAYFFDAIPKVADPRLFKSYNLPGYNDGVVSKFLGTKDLPLADSAAVLEQIGGDAKIKLRAKYTWLGLGYGQYGDNSDLFDAFTSEVHNMPSKSKKWTNNEQKRVFMAPWEVYFLIAEASLYGWDTGTSDKVAYENGIAASFEYLEIPSSIAAAYTASQNYNRVGTSVEYDHNTEAVAKNMLFVDIKDNLVEQGTENIKKINENPTISSVNYNYPKGLYDTNNDKLTKIITQKWIAQCPWLPLEAWNDYRRLGLPFMENPVREIGIVTMPEYTDYKVASVKNIPGRLPYPQNLTVSNKVGYDSGVKELAGPDMVATPLWWAKK